MPEKQYVRLTRLRRRRGKIIEGLGSYSGLWLGEDHLLSITSNRFSEQYKRFYFRDIQAVTILKTHRRRNWNLVFALLLLFCVAMLPTSGAAFVPLAILIIGGLLVLNNALGHTCTVYLQTAVQTEELSALSRVRRAYKVIDRILPLITAVQGELTTEETTARLNDVFPGKRTTLATGPLNL
jgi:hypothetical protein